MIELIEETEKVDLTNAITMLCDQLENNPEKFDTSDSWKDNGILKLVINITERQNGMDKILNDEEIERVAVAFRNYKRGQFNQRIITLIFNKDREETGSGSNNVNALKTSNSVFGAAQIKQEGASILNNAFNQAQNSIAMQQKYEWAEAQARAAQQSQLGLTQPSQGQLANNATATQQAMKQTSAQYHVESVRKKMEEHLRMLRMKVQDAERYGEYHKADHYRREFHEQERIYTQDFNTDVQQPLMVKSPKKSWWGLI